MHPNANDLDTRGSLQVLAFSPVWTGIFVGTAVLATAQFALQLQSLGLGVFWPATGVLIAAVLRTHGHHRWAALIGAALAYFVSGWISGRSHDASLVFAVANLLEAFGITYLLEYGKSTDFRLDSRIAVGRFVGSVFAVIAVSGLGVAWALVSLGHASAQPLEVWQVWFFSDVVGALTVAPWLIAITSGSTSFRQLQGEQWLNILVVAVASYVLVGTSSATELAVVIAIVILFPLIVLLTARSSLAGGALGLLTIAMAVVWHTTEWGRAFRR